MSVSENKQHTVKIIIVDDDEDVRVNTSDLLSTQFNDISAYASISAVLPKIKLNSPYVILTDLRMPDADGLEFVKQIRSIDSNIPILLMTGYGDISIAVDAMKQGVHDFIEKPFDTDHLLQTMARAVEKRSLTLSLLETKKDRLKQRPVYFDMAKKMTRFIYTIRNYNETISK